MIKPVTVEQIKKAMNTAQIGTSVLVVGNPPFIAAVAEGYAPPERRWKLWEGAVFLCL